jgi:hypothetical protein
MDVELTCDKDIPLIRGGLVVVASEEAVLGSLPVDYSKKIYRNEVLLVKLDQVRSGFY